MDKQTNNKTMDGDKKKKDYKGGRKPILDPAVFRYGFKLNTVENAKFISRFLESGMADKANFIKSMLFDKPIKVVKVDKAAMDYYMRLTTFYSQFQAVGVNYNQTVKAIKTNFSEKRALSLLYKLEKETIKLIMISKEIIQLTQEFEQKYLLK